jgi:hypothetical protein
VIRPITKGCGPLTGIKKAYEESKSVAVNGSTLRYQFSDSTVVVRPKLASNW